MIRIGLAGGRGYVGEELLRLLSNIPEYRVVYVGSRSAAGKHVQEEYQHTNLDLQFQDLSRQSVLGCQADVWVIAQPNGRAPAFASLVESTNARLVDISSDFRFDDQWVYGLPELNADSIARAERVANPGCYATATMLSLLPFRDLIDTSMTPVAFGVSGYSGAGRTPSDRNDPQRLENNLIPYSLAGHTHELEISRHIGFGVRFMPHVASFFRGISLTLNFQTRESVSREQLQQAMTGFYQRHPLIEVTDDIPEIRQVAESNQAVLGGCVVDARDGKQVALVCCIDNLRKGAASQAIQNLNLMFGMHPEHGLDSTAN